MKENKIHVIGDSHIMLFTGQKCPYLLKLPIEIVYPHPYDLYKEFDTYFCVLLRAFHLMYPEQLPQASNFFNILNHRPVGDTIVIVVGEIDCRAPLVNLVRKGLSPMKDAVEKCIERYMTGVNRVKELGYNPILFAPTPNQYVTEDRHEIIATSIGIPKDLTVKDWFDLKNEAVIYFNKILNQTNYPVISLIDWIFKENIQYDSSYWGDLIHLGEKVWCQLPKEFEKVGINLTLEKYNNERE